LPRSGRVVACGQRWTWKVLPSGVLALRGQGGFSQESNFQEIKLVWT